MAQGCIATLKETFKGMELPDEIYTQMDRHLKRIFKEHATDGASFTKEIEHFQETFKQVIIDMNYERITQSRKQSDVIRNADESIKSRKKRRTDKGKPEAVSDAELLQIGLAPYEKDTKTGLGARFSIDALTGINHQRLVEMYEDGIQQHGLRHLLDGRHSIDVYKAMIGLKDGTLKFNPQNKIHQMAKLSNYVQYEGVKMYRETGGSMRYDENYLFSAVHDAVRIKNHTFKTWDADLRGWLDPERPLMEFAGRISDEALTEKIRDAHVRIINGDYRGFNGQRSFNFKSVEAKVAYDLKYGTGLGHYQTLHAQMQNIARKAAVVSISGPDHGASHKRLKERLLQESPGLNTHPIDVAYDAARGASNVQLTGAAMVVKRTRDVVRMTALPKAARTGLLDIFATARAHHGLMGHNPMVAVGKTVRGIVTSSGRMFNQLTPEGRAANKKWLREHHVNAENQLGLNYSRIENESMEKNPRGFWAYWNYAVNTLNGLRFVTQLLKGGASEEQGRSLMKIIKNSSYDNLDTPTKNYLLANKIEKVDYDNIKKFLPDTDFTYTSLKRLSEDPKILNKLVIPEHYLPADPILRKNKDTKLMENIRKEYAVDLRNFWANTMDDFTDQAVVTMGLKENRRMQVFNKGIDRNTVGGILADNARQFKGTPLKVWHDVGFQADNLGGGNGRFIYMMGASVAMNTIIMAGLMSLSSVMAGEGLPWEQEDFDEGKWWEEMMARGGGIGIVQDFVMGMINDNPSRFLNSLIGPLNNKAMTLTSIGYKATVGERNMLGQIGKFAIYNTPGLGHPFMYRVRKGYIDYMNAYAKEVSRLERSEE